MIWSAASPDYVDFIAKNIIGKHGRIEHVFTSDHCEESEKQYKKLKMLKLLWKEKDLPGYGPYNTLIIDDLRHVTTETQPFNSIQIKRFVANPKNVDDVDLERVKEQLMSIKKRYDETPNKKTSYKLIDLKPKRQMKGSKSKIRKAE